MKERLLLKSFLLFYFLMLFSDSYAQYFTAISDTECELSFVYDDVQFLEVPSIVYIGQKKYYVTSIREKACEYNYKLVSVVLPNTIKTIGKEAFFFCSNLSSINIPASVISVGESAFWGCSSLKSINIPFLSRIESGAFGRTGITSVNIPPSVTSIGDDAFSTCSSLVSVSIPESVTAIGKEAFKDCTSLLSVTIPNSVTAIEERTFAGCSSLVSVNISSSVTVVGSQAFLNCANLTSVNIPQSVIKIEYEAFWNCSSLSSIIIPNSVTNIGNNVFRGCSSLSTVYIDCTIIGEVFRYNPYIQKVYLGKSVRSIGDCAFERCTGIKSISIPNTVNSIGEFVFNGCSSLITAKFSKSVKSIKKGAFQGCKSLVSITDIDNVESIGEWAFYDCDSLLSISLPNTIQSIEENAFRYDDINYIYLYAVEPPNCDETAFSRYSDKTLYVPVQSLEKYNNHEVWSQFNMFPLMDLTPEHGYDTYWNTDVDIIGITADGLSQLNVSQFTFEPFTVPVPDFETIKLKFELNGKECTDKKIIGKYGEVGWETENRWGFIYTAPEDFPKEIKENDYTLDVTLLSEKNGLVAIVGGTQIKVYRPGVMLVHGIFSNAGCFKYLDNYLQQFGGYEDSQILRVGYKSSNSATFENNTHRYRVIENNAEQLHKKLADEGIVSSAYDIVGHSMGGILARKYAQEIDKESVNRIITMNTPHSGSPLPDIYNNLATTVDLITSVLGGWPDIISSGLKLLAAYHKRWGNWGAIQDLSPSSDAIKKLNNSGNLNHAYGIPVHASCSTIKMDNAHSLIEVLNEATKWFTFMPSLIFFGKAKVNIPTDIDILKFLYGNDSHDGVVSFTSQRGGLDGQPMSLYQDDYKGIFGSKSNAFHTNNTDHPESLTRINKLLHESKTSNSFAKGFKPVDLSQKSSRRKAEIETADFKEPTESQFIKIEAEKEDTARIVKVTVTGSDDLWSNMVFFGLDEETLMSGIGQSEYRFQIPDTFEGDLTIYALGRTNDDALVGDTAVVSFKSAASLTYMYFEDWPSVTMTEGQQLELNVLAGWTNGEEKYVTPTYSTDKNGIIDIDGAMITAKGAGECQLFAQYGDLADTITVKVIPAIPSNIQSVSADKPIVKYYNGLLTVIANKAVSGNLAVEIYDLSGRPYLQRHLNVSLKEGERAAFDLSSLPSKLYIVKVSGAVDATLKFYKR